MAWRKKIKERGEKGRGKHMEPFTFCCSGRVSLPHTRVIHKHFPVADVCIVSACRLDSVCTEASVCTLLIGLQLVCERASLWTKMLWVYLEIDSWNYDVVQWEREKKSRKNGGLSVTCRPDKLVCRQNGLRALKQAKKQVNECATLCSFWADKFRSVFDVKVCLASQYLSALVCPETSSVCAPDREAIRRSLDILRVYLLCYSFCSLWRLYKY